MGRLSNLSFPLLTFLSCLIAACSPTGSQNVTTPDRGGATAAQITPSVDKDVADLEHWWWAVENNSGCSGEENIDPRAQLPQCKDINIRCAADEPVTPADQANGISRKVRIGITFIQKTDPGLPWSDGIALIEFSQDKPGGQWKNIDTIENYSGPKFDEQCNYSQ